MENSSHFSIVLCVCGEREGDDAIMKGGKAVMTLKIKQKKHLFFLKVCMNREHTAGIWSGVVKRFNNSKDAWVNN